MKPVYEVDDLVFAKVRGYPAWPARITGVNKGAYRVFFFGTHEVRGNMRPKMMWPYNQKNLNKFGPPNKHKKWYGDGLHQIENIPDIIMPPVGKKIRVPVVSNQEGLGVIVDTAGLNVDIASDAENLEEERKTSSTPRRYYDEETKSSLVKYVMKKKNLSAAARKFSIPFSTVWLWARKAGIIVNKKNCVRTTDKKHEEADIDDDGLAATLKVNHGGMKSKCEYKAVKKDDPQNLVQADSDLVDENSNVLKHASMVEDVNIQQSGTSKSKVFSPDTQGGSRCSSSLETKDAPMCKPCGYILEPDETLDEHIVSVHLIAEGLCDICGENSEDFLEHFQIHIGKLEDRYAEHPMVQIKIEMVNGLDCHMKIAEEVFEGNPLYG